MSGGEGDFCCPIKTTSAQSSGFLEKLGRTSTICVRKSGPISCHSLFHGCQYFSTKTQAVDLCKARETKTTKLPQGTEYFHEYIHFTTP